MSDGPIIIPEGTTGTKIMRGRDVQFLLQGKVDPITLDVLVKLAEINHTNTLAIAELANMQTQMIDIIQNFADIAGNMKDRSDQLLRATNQAKEASEGNENA